MPGGASVFMEKTQKADVRNLLACCDFFVPAADGGTFNATTEKYNELCAIHKSQFVSPIRGPNMWKVTISYKTQRGNVKTADKYVCINAGADESPYDEVRYALRVWSGFTPAYRKIDNVKILSVKYECRMAIRIG